MGLVVTMDIGLFIPPADYSAASASVDALTEKGQHQQSAQNGTFSAVLKDVAQDLSEEPLPLFSKADDPIEPASSTEAGDHATGVTLSGIEVAAVLQAQDLHESVFPVADKGESLQNSPGGTVQSIESIPLLPQGVSVVAPQDDGTVGPEPVLTDPLKPRTMDSSTGRLLQPVLDHPQLSETAAKQATSRALDVPPIRNDHGTLADLPPAPLQQLSSHATLPGTPLSSSPISDQRLFPLMEDQGERTLLSSVSVNGGIQSLDRRSTEVPSSVVVQEQVTEESLLPGPSLSASVIGVSGGRGQDLFDADAQGAGEGTFFDSGENGTPESLMRDNQSSFFNSQLMSARQAQSSIDGERSFGVTPPADQLKTAQALLGEDHSAIITSASGKAQAVHVELPSHDFGPLSVRISMTDQMVHTQFTTDRNDLGALLFTRQDQLQQNLAKSGLELGQFQVHIDQQGRQEALPDRQSRQNGGAPEQQPESQDHNQPAQDRERPIHRPSRALSLFA
jgi:hypothetical protein